MSTIEDALLRIERTLNHIASLLDAERAERQMQKLTTEPPPVWITQREAEENGT